MNLFILSYVILPENFFDCKNALAIKVFTLMQGCSTLKGRVGHVSTSFWLNFKKNHNFQKFYVCPKIFGENCIIQKVLSQGLC